MQRLYIANKNYSSWSMRAWLVLTAFDLDFEEILIRFDVTNPSFKEQRPTFMPMLKCPYWMWVNLKFGIL